MPAIHLFQRRTLLGGDDLQVPALCTILLRFAQGVCLALPLGWQVRRASQADAEHNGGGIGSFLHYLLSDPSEKDDKPFVECHNSHFFPLLVVLYLAATLLFVIMSCGLESRILTWTCYGTPTQPNPRSYHIETLMEIKLLVFTVFLALIVLTGISATVFATTYRRCHLATSSAETTQLNDPDTYYAYDLGNYQDSGYSDNYLIEYPQRSHRFGSTTWWIAYSLLGLSQISEIVFTFAVLLRLLCTSKSPVEYQQDQSTAESSAPTSSSPSRNYYQYQPNQRNLNTDNVNDGQYHPHSSAVLQEEEEMWATRCHTLCSCLSVSTCFLFGGRDLWTGRFDSRSGAATTAATATTSATGVPYYYNAVARALADYLETFGILDVVPTDLVMGLIVLQRVQRRRILEARLEVLQAHQQLTTTRSPPSSQGPRQPLLRSMSSSSTTTTGGISMQQQASHPSKAADTPPRSADSQLYRQPVETTVVSPSLGLRSRTNSTNDLTRFGKTTTMTKTTTDGPAANASQAHDNDSTTSSDPLCLWRDDSCNSSVAVEALDSATTSCRRRRLQRVRTSIYRRRRRRHLSDEHARGTVGLDFPTNNAEGIADDTGGTPRSSTYFDDNDQFFDEYDDDEERGASATSVNQPQDAIQYQRQTRHVLTAYDPHHVRLLQDGARFARYALSIYTWLLYLYVNPISGVPQLLCGRTRRQRGRSMLTTASVGCCSSSSSSSSCCLFCLETRGRVGNPRRRLSPPHQEAPRQPQQQVQQQPQQLRTRRSSSEDEDDFGRGDTSLLETVPAPREQNPPQVESPPSSLSNHDQLRFATPIVGDTVCELHKHSLLLTAQIDESELIYAHFWNSLSSVPYCILLDHVTQSVVVTVRGTLSLDDLVTDVDLDPEPLEIWQLNLA